jgi:hypothetical protein
LLRPHVCHIGLQATNTGISSYIVRKATLICTAGCQNTNVLQGMTVFLRVFCVEEDPLYGFHACQI